MLHIDEAHTWAVPYDFTRKHLDELISASDCKNYFFIILSEVFEELRAHDIAIKIVITGTNVFMDRIIRFASNVCIIVVL